MTGSSGRQRVQTDVVKEHVFDAPELAEQRAIASILSSLDDKIDLLHRQNHTLSKWRRRFFDSGSWSATLSLTKGKRMRSGRLLLFMIQ
jgi:restriction endonuclease S subunit